MPEHSATAFFDVWHTYRKVVATNYMHHMEIKAHIERVLRAQFAGRPFSFLDLGCGDAATLAPLLDKFVLTPVALAGRVLPGMLERGDGGLLFALGASAKYPMPHLASGGMVLSGLRNFVHTLHAELGPENIYAGALVIGALIEGSPAHRNASAWGGEQHLAVVPAEDLAERYWDMYLKRDRVEEEVAPGLAASAVRGEDAR
jgi:NAD(P)-dependent dehydrogenase (short-subunit alcohol dehydrogenase family)